MSFGVTRAIGFDDVGRLAMERDRLRSAIELHRDQKADDRCWLDDDRLYAALEDGVKCDRRVGSRQEMLANCARFIDRRCSEGEWPSYVQLEAEIARLKAVIHDLALSRHPLRP